MPSEREAAMDEIGPKFVRFFNRFLSEIGAVLVGFHG